VIYALPVIDRSNIIHLLYGAQEEELTAFVSGEEMCPVTAVDTTVP